MEAADIIKLKELEDENRRFKQMFADLSLECRALKDVIEKCFKTGDKAWACQLSDGAIFHKLTPGMQDVIAEQERVPLLAWHPPGWTGDPGTDWAGRTLSAIWFQEAVSGASQVGHSLEP